jgi:hypothetical protein
MTKLKPESWDQLPRQSKLAACLWPDLVPKHIRDEMRSIARSEDKTDPLSGKVAREQARRQQQQTKRR